MSGLAATFGLGAAFAFGEFVDRQLTRPYKETTGVLLALADVKHMVGELTRTLPGPGRDEPGITAIVLPDPDSQSVLVYDEHTRVLHGAVEHLRALPAFERLCGVSTARNLLLRIDAAEAIAYEWFDTGDSKTGIDAGFHHYEIHEIIERIESRVLAESEEVIALSGTLRALHRLIVGSGIGAVILLALLTVMLIRRWVVRPVASLRVAASEIAKGHYEYRAPVAGSDELSLLAREVNEMAGRIVTMQEEAVSRERLASVGEMVRRIAHNIRNPLAGIRGTAELSIRRAGEQDRIVADQREIIAAVDQFNTWITELLRTTTPAKVLIALHDVGPWLTGQAEAIHPLASMRGVTLHLDLGRAPEAVFFDPVHLGHAMSAVITNAVQVAPGGSEVEIECVAGQDDDWWVVRVSDRGPGIPLDLRESIFRPYFTTKPDGTGIGLAVAREVALKHGGSIGVLEREGGGMTFEFRLPMRAETPEW